MTTETETALERQVREEQEQHDADAARELALIDPGVSRHAPDAAVSGDSADPPIEDDGQVTAFSAADYDREDLQIAKIDGQSITKIALKFSGRVMLDRSDPANVALFNRAILGKELIDAVTASLARWEALHQSVEDPVAQIAWAAGLFDGEGRLTSTAT